MGVTGKQLPEEAPGQLGPNEDRLVKMPGPLPNQELPAKHEEAAL